jgi:hypothetical protein
MVILKGASAADWGPVVAALALQPSDKLMAAKTINVPAILFK